MADLKKFLSLIIFFIVVCALAGIGYVVYMIVDDVTKQTSKKMEKKNIKMSRDGMKVGVKQVSSEQVADSTQSVLMKVWNSAAWPAYQSKLGWGQGSKTTSSSVASTPASTPGVGTEKRTPFVRSGSSQQNTKRS